MIEKLKVNKRLLNICFLLIILLLGLILVITFSLEDRNDWIHVAENSDLTYYLKISYNGKDKYGTLSSTAEGGASTTARLYGDVIFVEDKIPDGLEFTGFEETENGTFGAVDSENKICTGYVIDDTGNYEDNDNELTYHGLHYNKNNRTVTFKIKNLQAGCFLTVGLKARTPFLGNNELLVFRNTATASENGFRFNSNEVTLYMGQEFSKVRSVTYQIENATEEITSIIANTNLIPNAKNYTVGEDVKLLDVSIPGYRFSGWSTTSSDLSIVNNIFKMPDRKSTRLNSSHMA